MCADIFVVLDFIDLCLELKMYGTQITVSAKVAEGAERKNVCG